MRVLIENYRGWEIFFDTDKEIFYSASDEYDSAMTKKSFAASKKSIDDFIKENTNFKPFWVEKFGYMSRSWDKIKIIGVRKDGNFVYLDKKEKPAVVSKYDENDYILVKEENTPVFEKLCSFSAQIEELKAQSTEVEKQVIRETLKSIKHKYVNSK